MSTGAWHLNSKNLCRCRQTYFSQIPKVVFIATLLCSTFCFASSVVRAQEAKRRQFSDTCPQWRRLHRHCRNRPDLQTSCWGMLPCNMLGFSLVRNGELYRKSQVQEDFEVVAVCKLSLSCLSLASGDIKRRHTNWIIAAIKIHGFHKSFCSKTLSGCLQGRRQRRSGRHSTSKTTLHRKRRRM